MNRKNEIEQKLRLLSKVEYVSNVRGDGEMKYVQFGRER